MKIHSLKEFVDLPWDDTGPETYLTYEVSGSVGRAFLKIGDDVWEIPLKLNSLLIDYCRRGAEEVKAELRIAIGDKLVGNDTPSCNDCGYMGTLICPECEA